MSGTFQTIPLASIDHRPQVRRRFDEASIDDLAQSIAEAGLQEPPVVYREGDRFRIISGERRVLATQRRGESSVEVRVVDAPASAADLVVRQLASNAQRVDLTPIERAEAAQVLLTEGLTVVQVAKTMGSSPSQVTKDVKLLRLSPSLQAAVAEGRLAPDAAYQLTQVEDEKQRDVLAAEVLGHRLKRDALARKIKRIKRGTGGCEPTPVRVMAMLGDGRSVTLAGKGLSLDSVIEWLEQFLAKAKKAKSQSLSLETFVRAMKDQAAKGVTP